MSRSKIKISGASLGRTETNLSTRSVPRKEERQAAPKRDEGLINLVEGD